MDQHFNRCMHVLQKNLRETGYPMILMNTSIEKASKISRECLLKENNEDKQAKKTIQFIYTHNPNSPLIAKILKRFEYLLHKNESTKFIWNTSILAVTRRCSNLRSTFVTSSLDAVTLASGSYKCGQNCVTCQFMSSNAEFKSTVTGRFTKPVTTKYVTV